MALTLAAIGIYGVMAYSVRRRTRELGTRVALGASRADIIRLVMREGGVITLAGVGVGLVTGVLAARSLSAVLFGVPPSDPLSMTAAALLLGLTAMAACYLPARRASPSRSGADARRIVSGQGRDRSESRPPGRSPLIRRATFCCSAAQKRKPLSHFTPSNPPMLPSGTRLGPYEVLGLIGEGGMGQVYRAADTRLDRAVAIKVMPAALAADPIRRERFEREARSISRLEHPNICPLYDVGELPAEVGGGLFLVMQFLEGETLAQRLSRGPLSIKETLDVGIQIAEALAAAHRAGIVHRDLKPGNVMLTRAGARLLDFGLARTVAAASADGETSATAPPIAPR